MVRLNLFILSSNSTVAVETVPRWVQTGKGEQFDTNEPLEQLVELVLSDIDWQIDLTNANPEEAEHWIVADLFSRQLRARRFRKVVMLDNEPLSEKEFGPAILAYCKQYGMFPDILQDDEHALIIGTREM